MVVICIVWHLTDKDELILCCVIACRGGSLSHGRTACHRCQKVENSFALEHSKARERV